MKKPIFMDNKKQTKMIAHRGLSGIELENTLGAFIAAGNRSYFGIETDVHRTADGEFVVIHDDDTNRVSDQNLSVENAAYADLRRVQLGHTADDTARADRKIPSLREYIQVCKTYGKTAVLELKNHFEKDDIIKICAIIQETDYLKDTIFISFDFSNLLCLRERLPEQRLQYLCCAFSDELVERLVKHQMDVDMLYSALTRENIEKFHENGILVNCWTVNEPADAEKLIEYGIDYITSNILE